MHALCNGLKFRFVIYIYIRQLKNYFKVCLPIDCNVHSRPKLKLQPVLLFSSFMHNSSVNEHKNMKLRENICYKMIN